MEFQIVDLKKNSIFRPGLNIQKIVLLNRSIMFKYFFKRFTEFLYKNALTSIKKYRIEIYKIIRVNK